jgi:hypothetical protein
MALRDLLEQPRTFAMWPFEGELDTLVGSRGTTVAEMYPRAAYATALIDGPPHCRPRLAIAKTDRGMRQAALEQLEGMRWVRYGKVRFEGLDCALDNEDDFDACVTAAALLRCVIEELPFTEPLDSAAGAEGGILGSGSVNLDLPETTYRAARPSTPVLPAQVQNTSAAQSHPCVHDVVGRQFACPIPGCSKVFVGSRGGWDGHVGAVRQHPSWHRDVMNPEERRHLFRREFPTFFSD